MDGPQVGKRWEIGLFGATLLLLGSWVVHSGIRMCPDAHTFERWAEQLRQLGWNYGAFLEGAHSTAPPLLYLGIITLAALCQTLVGPGWGGLLVGLNVAGVSFLAVALAWCSRTLGGDWRAGAGTVALLWAGFDLWQWVRYPISDTTFLALEGLLLTGLVGLVMGCWGRPRVAIVALGLGGLVATFYRPTGFLLWAPTLVAFARVWAGDSRPRLRRWLVAAAGLAVALIGLNAHLMGRVSETGTSNHGLQHQAQHYAMGEVVWDRKDTWHGCPQNDGDRIRITLDRWRWFFSPVHASFSLGHNLGNLLFFLPLYGLAVAAGVRMRSADLSPGECWGRLMLVSTVFAVSLWHALIQVDYDWRYRLPALPPLLILAGCGLSDWQARKDSGQKAIP